MRQCSVCNRLFDERFTVFAPPHAEPFDRIECARRAAVAWGFEERLAPIVLPTIEAFRSRSEPLPALVGPRLSLAALAVVALYGGQAALAGGTGLLAGGTAASVYLAAKPSPAAPESKPTVRVQSPSTSRGTSPQGPATSVVTGPPDAFVRERPAVPKRALAPRRAGRDTVEGHARIAVARNEKVAVLPLRAVPGVEAAPQRPAQSSTESRAATPTAEPKPNPKKTDTQKPNPTATPKPKRKPEPTDTPKAKPTDTPKAKPKDTPKPKDTDKPKPPAAKPPPAESAPAPPKPQSTPASPPESHPPTPTPPTTSEPPTHAPPDEPPGSPGQNGNHGEDKGNKGGGR